MQFATIGQNAKLDDVRALVGNSNLENVLAINSLSRTPNIGAQVAQKQNNAARNGKSASLDAKINSLGRASGDSDVFENMALMGESGWRVYNTTGALPGTIKIPEGVQLPNSQSILGNSIKVSNDVYTKTITSLKEAPHFVDPGIFNTYSNKPNVNIHNHLGTGPSNSNPFDFAKIPWGKMTIYSSISGTSKDFPVYPEELTDNAKANYVTMPEILYQYEPWQLYNSSGPRMNTYNFTFHRDMWTGDHRDGMANALIRFCMANCYPEYNGSAVHSALTTLYMNGAVLIRGILTDVTVTWDGPLGQDNYYLVCKLSLTFIEVAQQPLDYWTMMSKPLIGW